MEGSGYLQLWGFIAFVRRYLSTVPFGAGKKALTCYTAPHTSTLGKGESVARPECLAVLHAFCALTCSVRVAVCSLGWAGELCSD